MLKEKTEHLVQLEIVTREIYLKIAAGNRKHDDLFSLDSEHRKRSKANCQQILMYCKLVPNICS